MASRMIPFLVMLCFCLREYGCSKVLAISTEDLELERKLQSLNKPPVKTIQVEEGDVFDCIDIYQQPTLDHPLLKNHKIQLRPTWIPATQTKRSDRANEPLEAGFKHVGCPNGTVPIQRTTKEDLIRTKTLSDQMFSSMGETNAIAPNVHQAFLKLNGSMMVIRFTGVLGSGAIYSFTMAPDQSSSTNVWVDSGPRFFATRLIAGSLVSQSINGDTKPRFFIYSTLDADKTGCFNLRCAGFIQVDRNVGPGASFDHVSTIGGNVYDSKFSIYQDPVTKNWWLVASPDNINVGYWPKEMVPKLENGAGDVGLGGIAMAQENEDGPPMGSGQYPSSGAYDYVGYFRDVHFMKDGIEPRIPTEADPVIEYSSDFKCYGLQNDKDTKTEFGGYRFEFGGPGGSCGGEDGSKLR